MAAQGSNSTLLVRVSIGVADRTGGLELVDAEGGWKAVGETASASYRVHLHARRLCIGEG